MNHLDHQRARMIIEDGAGRWYFPLGPISRPRAVPDRQAEDGLLRDLRRGSWPLMVGVTLLFGASLWTHFEDLDSLSILLLVLGLGLFILMRQRVARNSTREWRQGPRWPLGRWLRLRAVTRSWWLITGQLLAWGMLTFVGVMILVQGREGSTLQGVLQTGVSGIALFLELATLLAKAAGRNEQDHVTD
jgi:hypothetical protein